MMSVGWWHLGKDSYTQVMSLNILPAPKLQVTDHSFFFLVVEANLAFIFPHLPPFSPYNLSRDLHTLNLLSRSFFLTILSGSYESWVEGEW